MRGGRGALACAVVLLLGAGCREIAGVDQYAVADSVPEASGGGTYLAGEECSACLAKRCEEELAACAASKSCSAWLACHRTCSDPSCMEWCWASLKAEIESEEASLDGGELPNPGSCALFSCASECHIGTELSCVGTYAPRLRDPSDEMFDVTVWAFVFAGSGDGKVSGVQVSACKAGSVDCRPGDFIPEGVGVTDASRVDLSWPMQGGTGFTGHFAFEDEREDAGDPDGGIGEGRLVPARFLKTTPFIETGYNLALPTINAFDIFLGVTKDKPKFDPERAYATVHILDCGGNASPGIKISVSTADASTRYLYWSGYLPTEGLAETTGDGLVSVLFLPAGGISVVTATERATGRVVARGRFAPLAGTYFYIYLLPLTQSQALEQFD